MCLVQLLLQVAAQDVFIFRSLLLDQFLLLLVLNILELLEGADDSVEAGWTDARGRASEGPMNLLVAGERSILAPGRRGSLRKVQTRLLDQPRRRLVRSHCFLDGLVEHVLSLNERLL